MTRITEQDVQELKQRAQRYARTQPRYWIGMAIRAVMILLWIYWFLVLWFSDQQN